MKNLASNAQVQLRNVEVQEGMETIATNASLMQIRKDDSSIQYTGSDIPEVRGYDTNSFLLGYSGF